MKEDVLNNLMFVGLGLVLGLWYPSVVRIVTGFRRAGETIDHILAELPPPADDKDDDVHHARFDDESLRCNDCEQVIDYAGDCVGCGARRPGRARHRRHGAANPDGGVEGYGQLVHGSGDPDRHPAAANP